MILAGKLAVHMHIFIIKNRNQKNRNHRRFLSPLSYLRSHNMQKIALNARNSITNLHKNSSTLLLAHKFHRQYDKLMTQFLKQLFYISKYGMTNRSTFNMSCQSSVFFIILISLFFFVINKMRIHNI